MTTTPAPAPRSYIVIVSPSYGGAEKRFFDIFTGLRRQGVDVQLVGPSSLVDRLLADHPERADVHGAMVSVPLPAWSRAGFVLRWRRMLRGLPRGSRFHYPLNPLWFVHLGRGDKVSMSVADSARIPGPLGGTLTSVLNWIAFFFTTRIDVLGPQVLEAMRGYRMAHKMALTPGGTFLIPPRGAAVAKAPTVVFLGRLVPLKGVDHYFDVLPSVHAALKGRVPEGFAFEVAGYGPLEAHVRARIDALAATGVPIRFIGYAVADAVLAGASLLVSMQEITNYPSRVVAEALVAGCGVVVRNTGESMAFGTDLPGLAYCRGELDSAEIAGLIVAHFARTANDPAYTRVISQAALTRFSSPQYLDHFRDMLQPRRVSATP